MDLAVWVISYISPFDLVAQSAATPPSPILGSSIHAASRLRLTIDATLGTSFSSMNEQPIRYIQSAISEHDRVAVLVEVAEPVSLPFHFLDPRVC